MATHLDSTRMLGTFGYHAPLLVLGINRMTNASWLLICLVVSCKATRLSTMPLVKVRSQGYWKYGLPLSKKGWSPGCYCKRKVMMTQSILVRLILWAILVVWFFLSSVEPSLILVILILWVNNNTLDTTQILWYYELVLRPESGLFC